jgi:hypothetical protein
LYLNSADIVTIRFWAFNDTLIVGASSCLATLTEMLPPSAGFVGSASSAPGFAGSFGYTGSLGSGFVGSRGAVIASISPTPPVSPGLGDVWINSTTGIQYFYVADADSAQWIEFSNPGARSIGGSGGASGSNGDQVFYENDQIVTTSYTITSGKSAMTAGPVTITSGAVVTIPNGSRWVIL